MVIRVDSKTDEKNNKSLAKIKLLLKNQTLLSGDIYFDNNGITINAPDLYEKGLSLSYKDLNKMMDYSRKQGISKIEPYKKL